MIIKAYFQKLLGYLLKRKDFLEFIIKKNLIILFLVFFILGILYSKKAVWAFVISIFIYLTFLIIYKIIRIKNINLLILVTLFFFIFNYANIATYQRLHPKTSLKETKKVISIKVLVLEEPSVERLVTFKAKLISNGDKVLVRWKNRGKNWVPEYGDILLLKGTFSKPLAPTNPGQYNYRRYLITRGIVGIFKVDKLRLCKQTFGNPFKRLAFFLKKKIIAINRKTLPYPYSDLYIGLVFGDHGTKLPEKLSDDYQKVGLTHLLVVSGSQVALLSGILLTLFTSLNLSRRLTFILVTLCNILFYFLTGGGASIFRAILMSEIALGIKFLKRKASFYHVTDLPFIFQS